MLCLVAFVLSPSDRLMSSIELPFEMAEHECRALHLAQRRHRRVDSILDFGAEHESLRRCVARCL